MIDTNIRIGHINFDLADESSKFLEHHSILNIFHTHHKKCHWGHRSNKLIDPYLFSWGDDQSKINFFITSFKENIIILNVKNEPDDVEEKSSK